MIASWGNFFFPVNQAAVTYRLNTERGENRRELRRVFTVNCRATLDGSTQAELTIAENLCKIALAQPFQDFVLRQDNGSPSGIQLINATSLSGCRIIDGPNFPEALSPEYVNARTVEFTVEAVYLVPGAENAILAWQETISVQGSGGPGYVMRRPINTEPFPQQVSPSTPIITTQRGSAVGHMSEPRYPEPMFGRVIQYGYYDAEAEVKDKGSPKALGRAWIEYPINWSYRWIHSRPLLGTPTRPPLF